MSSNGVHHTENNVAIKLEGVSKCFQIYDQPHHRLLQGLFRGKKQYFKEFWALKDISFEVKKGETLGVIGRNGAGKSTLLQIICGTLGQTTGIVNINGRVAALLELGAGFNPEFTGRENVYMNATVLGLSKEETEFRFDDILVFANIGEFIDQPIKTYSSGMVVRLAFAVIAHVDADILIIDEALAVGDAFFTQKCMRFLRTFMKTGTVLFVSHDTGAVVNLCNKAVLLNQGQVTKMGDPKHVITRYLETLYESKQEIGEIGTGVSDAHMDQVKHSNEYRDMREAFINGSSLRNDIEVFRFDPDQSEFGTGEAEIISVCLLDPDKMPLSWVVGGEDVILEIRCLAHKQILQPIIGFLFKDRLGQIIFTDNTFLSYQFDPQAVDQGSEFLAKFEFRLPVLPTGDYAISVAIAEGSQESHVQHHWMHDALIVRVHASSIPFGLVGIPMKRIMLGVV